MSIHEWISGLLGGFFRCARRVGFTKKTRDPGARNNTRKRVNGALRELDVLLHSKSMFRLQKVAMATQRAGSATEAARYAYIEQLHDTTAQS